MGGYKLKLYELADKNVRESLESVIGHELPELSLTKFILSKNEEEIFRKFSNGYMALYYIDGVRRLMREGEIEIQ